MRATYPSDTIGPLPIRVRPRPAETTDSFILRLARANHIRPSLLHQLATEPPITIGGLRFDLLATLASCTPEILQRTLVSAGSLLTAVKSDPALTDNENAQIQLFFEIQRDARGRGLTVRTLAKRHGVSRRILRRAWPPR